VFLEVRILKELWAQILEVRILKDLAGEERNWKIETRNWEEGSEQGRVEEGEAERSWLR